MKIKVILFYSCLMLLLSSGLHAFVESSDLIVNNGGEVGNGGKSNDIDMGAEMGNGACLPTINKPHFKE